jgi:NAD(P)H-dependent FMN reductase
MTVRLLTVCGSLQRRSANRALLDALTSHARAAGAVVDGFAALADVPAFDPDREDDAIPAVDEWRRSVAGADAVVIAAPEYAGALAGAVKNALDWLVGGGQLYRKPVAVLSAGSTGGSNARRMLAQTLTWQGALVVADLGVAAPRTKSDDAGRLTDPATLDALDAVVEAVVAAPAMAPADVVALARRVVGALGVDADRVVAPA